MVSLVSNTVTVVIRVLRTRSYGIGFVVLAVGLMALLFQLQVITIPSNSIRMQFALFEVTDWLLLGTVSAVNALFVVVQWYTFRLAKLQHPSTLAGLATGGVGTSSSVLASIFGTATCGLCATAVFGFLGANTVVFLVAHRQAITIGAIAVLLLSLVLVTRRFTASCEECKIPT